MRLTPRVGASFCTHPPYFVGTPPPVGGLPPRRTGPPLRSVALLAAGGVTTDPPLGRCPCREPPETLSLLLANRHVGASKSPGFTMKTSHAAKRQGDFFAEARASPTPHTYVEHPRSRRPDPACAVFVQALAALQFSTVRARIVPSNDYDDLPESLIDTSPPPLTGSSASESRSSDSKWQSIRVLDAAS